jgi:thiamine biosynthesis lipoprotein
MGVQVVTAGAGEPHLTAIQDLFERWEAAFSRFRPDSELNRVNSAESGLVTVSPLFSRVVKGALAAAAASGGLVDPTLGNAIEAAGYDRDFALLEPDQPAPGPGEPGRWRSVRVAEGLLLRPPGIKLDLNGVAKSLAVDDALELLPRGFVAAGGDIATNEPIVAGLPGGQSISLLSGGLATSGRTARRWLRAGRPQHHLIDPRTGRPSTSRWLEVTVAAGSCLAADVAAKAAFLLSSDGPRWLEDQGLAGRFVGVGETVETERWRASLS